jgi:hypothetical protein
MWVLTFWLVSQFNGYEVVDFVACYFCCGDGVGDVVVAAIEAFNLSVMAQSCLSAW